MVDGCKEKKEIEERERLAIERATSMGTKQKI
jgi:hypothetical protein